MKFELALKKIIATFKDFSKDKKVKIQFCLIGGLAVSAWGRIRATEDIDFLISLPVQEEQLKRAFEEKGCICELKRAEIDDPIPILLEVKVPVDKDEITTQIIIATRAWEHEFAKSTIILDIEGLELPVLRGEELIIMKLKAGEPLDILDAKDLFRLLKESGEININTLKRKACLANATKELNIFLEKMEEV
jgi:predicted nucleotidyltransferase